MLFEATHPPSQSRALEDPASPCQSRPCTWQLWHRSLGKLTCHQNVVPNVDKCQMGCVVYVMMVCKWKHEVMHPRRDVAKKWYHIIKGASNYQILCFSQIPTRTRRAHPQNSNCYERAERVLKFHDEQTSPKASLNFKGSLQHPNLSLPDAFSTNPITNARSARSSIQLKTKTWNIYSVKGKYCRDDLKFRTKYCCTPVLFFHKPEHALSALGQDKP